MTKPEKSLTLAKKIRQARKSVGLSQKDLAKVLELTDKAVSSYEVGRAVPSVETLREISKVTYKPFSYFMSEAEEQTGDEELAEKIDKIDRELQEIKELLKKKNG
jgi:transcriptional regulator with XRE-family HTH domain